MPPWTNGTGAVQPAAGGGGGPKGFVTGFVAPEVMQVSP